MEKLTTVGIDLAKDVIAVCVLDVHGAVIERRVLRRDAFERWAGQLPVSNVVMEACGSAHHWGRWFAARGHSARLIAAEFVVPFRKGGKNDTADAEAIAIAATAADDALRADQERRSAGHSGLAQRARGLEGGTHGASQPGAWAARRIWGRHRTLC